MFAQVIVDPRAESSALARDVRLRIEHHLQTPDGLSAFKRMWGTVVLVCRPEDLSRGGVPLGTLTLRFDYGRLVIHEGRVGRPDVTLWGTEAQLLGADESMRTPWERAAHVLNSVTRRAPQGLTIFGAMTRPRFVYRLLKLLSA